MTAETLTLAELKAENAKDEAVEQPKPEAEQKEKLVDDYVEEIEETKAVVTEELEVEDDKDLVVESEAWMLPDEDSEKKGFVPNAEAAKKRLKTKELRGSLKEKDNELEQLRAENENLRRAQPGTVQEESLPSRPKLADFDYDDDRYEEALDDWTDKKIELKLSKHSAASNQKQTAQQQQETYKKDLDTAVESHYSRASKLVESGKVSAELYSKADKSVRQLVEAVYPDKGDQITDGLIKTLNSLGEGSEKVMFSLGVNQARRDRFEALLRKDAYAATAYLGSLQTELVSPNNRKSSAPNPAPTIQGDAVNHGKIGALQKQYNKSGDVQQRLDLKRKARSEGVDTKGW